MKKFLLMLMAVVCSVGLSAQTRTVTGVVTSADDGEPLAGATVVPVGGNGQGTATDVDGHFSIQVPSSVKQLHVSYVGMKAETVNITPGVMKIQLHNADTHLDEVMVVAFGTAKKSAFTGSATVVKADEIEKHTTSNVANMLAGSVAGLQMRGQSGQPGSDNGSFSIRGINSLYATGDPLIVLDGAPFSGNLNNVAPEDIESVSVLKDASSAALYGARGAAGVIIITTKKGSGQAKVSTSLSWGVNQRSVQDYNVIKNPAEYYEAAYTSLYNYAMNVGGYTPALANTYANNNLISSVGYQVYDVPEGQRFIGLNGKVNPLAKLGRSYTAVNGITYYLTPDDWTDLAYRNGFRQEYSVSVNGANDKSSFYASVNYLDEEGFIQYSSYDRLSTRLKADYQIKRWLTVGANVSFTHSNQENNANLSSASSDWGSTNLFYYTSFIAPIYPAYIRQQDAAGNVFIQKDSHGYEAYDYGVSATNYYGLTRPFMQTGNPLGSNRYNKVNTVQNWFNGTFTADVTFTDYLKANITSTVTYRNSRFSDYENGYYGPKAGVNGELNKYSNEVLSTNNIQTLTFVKNFGKNYVNAMIGHEYYRTEQNYLSGSANGGFSPDILELYAFGNIITANSYKLRYNVEGYFLSAQYNYDEKYYASLSYRRDASSRFAKAHRWGDFWSFGAAWLINKDFLADNEKINLLKIKASIGQQGNDNLGSSIAYYNAYSDLFQLNRSNGSISPSFALLGNQDLTWETTTNFNAGVEFSFFNDRLSGSIEAYDKITENLLFWLSVPESLGARGYYGNVGKIRNAGVEVNLNGVLLQGKDYNWSLTLNFSHNSSKILSLPKDKTLDNGGFYESMMWYTEGGALYDYMTYAYAGVDENGYALYYYDPDLGGGTSSPTINVPSKTKSKEYVTTNPDYATRYTTGDLLPKLYGGISTSAQWRDFDVSLSFDYQLGGRVWDFRYQQLMTPPVTSSDWGMNYHQDWVNAWSPTNTSSDIPVWQYGTQNQYAAANSDRWLTSASYLNFQSFTVGYTIPKKGFKNFAKVRIYCSGENLCFWSARKGLDPRYAYDGNEYLSTYSPSRTITGGIQVSF